MKKNLTPLPTGRQATPLLEAEGSNKNYLLNKKKPSWFFVTLCLCGGGKINNKEVKIRNKEVAFRK